MFNVLTDLLPKDYKGYLINYQYYNGILINECLKDRECLFDNDDYGKVEKIYTAFTILYGSGIPEFNTALEGLNWFISCDIPRTNEPENKEEVFDFNIDSQLLYSSFRAKYSINLAKEKDLHWFEFIYLFNDLTKTSFRETVNMRQMKPSQYKDATPEYKEQVLRVKREFSLNIKSKRESEELTKEQRQKMIDFYRVIGKQIPKGYGGLPLLREDVIK